MRGQFFLWLFMGLIALAILYFVWMVLRAIYLTFEDMWTNRELRKLGDEYADKRKRSSQAAQQRLANGCEHKFDDQAGALPPDVCCRCGMAREKPAGECDHLWHVLPGIVPCSRCEKCGEEYSGVTVH